MVYMYHSFLIHSSADGHLGCFHVLAIINSMQADSLPAEPPGKPAMQETWVWSLGWEDPLEEGMATHSSILAWRIPMDRGAWWAAVHGVAKSRTWLSDWAQHSTDVFELISKVCVFHTLLKVKKRKKKRLPELVEKILKDKNQEPSSNQGHYVR